MRISIGHEVNDCARELPISVRILIITVATRYASRGTWVGLRVDLSPSYPEGWLASRQPLCCRSHWGTHTGFLLEDRLRASLGAWD